MTKTSGTDQYLEKVIRKLEVEGNDLYGMFSDNDADCFTTHDLIVIHSRLKERKMEFRLLNKRLIYLMVLCPAFFIISYLFSLIGWPVFSMIAFAIAPVLFLMFLGGSFYLYRKYGSRGDLNFLIEKASRELRRRQRLGIY